MASRHGRERVMGPLRHFEESVDDLVEEPLRFADFCIRLPAGPGLGVTLDQDKLRRYARR